MQGAARLAAGEQRGDELRSRAHIELPVDVLEVRVDRLLAQRQLHRGLAVIAAIVSAASFALVAGLDGNLLPFLLLALGAYGVFAGAYEVVWGLRHRGLSPLARDGITVGAGTVILALILVAVGDSVSAVGFFGAYAVIVGVYHALAAASARPARTTASERSQA